MTRETILSNTFHKKVKRKGRGVGKFKSFSVTTKLSNPQVITLKETPQNQSGVNRRIINGC
jgi:hypothetical protein